MERKLIETIVTSKPNVMATRQALALIIERVTFLSKNDSL